MPPRVLIIDDQLESRTVLRMMLARHPEIEVVGEAASAKAARPLLRRDSYNLVLLDVHLGDGSGFDLMPDVNRRAHVVFVTGSDDHARRAFEVNALDYLVKPVSFARLAESLRRFKQHPARPAAPPVRALRMDDMVQLASSAQARFAKVGDICAITAQENYTRIHLAGGESILMRRSLKAWGKVLPALHFFRVHRTAIVNLACVTSHRRGAPKAIALRVKGVPHPVAVGREDWPALKERLAGRFPKM